MREPDNTRPLPLSQRSAAGLARAAAPPGAAVLKARREGAPRSVLPARGCQPQWRRGRRRRRGGHAAASLLHQNPSSTSSRLFLQWTSRTSKPLKLGTCCATLRPFKTCVFGSSTSTGNCGAPRLTTGLQISRDLLQVSLSTRHSPNCVCGERLYTRMPPWACCWTRLSPCDCEDLCLVIPQLARPVCHGSHLLCELVGCLSSPYKTKTSLCLWTTRTLSHSVMLCAARDFQNSRATTASETLILKPSTSFSEGTGGGGI